jgi:recombination protein RecR
MTNYNFPSRLLEEAVNEFSKLPGIGNKTALRLVLHLLRQPPAESDALGNAIIRLRKEIKHCEICHNISDNSVCHICSDPRRDKYTICVVENIRDVMSIENTHQFKGIYHVLGGIISPMDGIGPSDLSLSSLEEKVKKGSVSELIMALPTTMEGDTTSFYIYRKIKDSGIRISTIARGVAIGDDLEYADEITLGRSILNRTAFEITMRG